MLEVGQDAPQFSLPATGGQTISLDQFKGQKNLVLYFYPKDSTPGCTKEGQAFRDMYPDFQAADCEILGASKDGIKAHENFKAKQEFPFELLSDKEGSLCEDYGVFREKKMYGKTYMGIVRSTFVIDKDGKIAKVWDKVKVKGHVEEVLEFVQSMD